MAITQHDIVQAAIRVLDRGGLPAVTLRAVAAELGVTAPTLYWHVRDKRHLLDLVAGRLSLNAAARRAGTGTGPGPGPGQPVWEWLREHLRARRAALLEHRDTALVVAGDRPVPEMLPHIETLLSALVRAGCTAPEAVRVATALGSYVIGEVLETQRSHDGGHDPALAELITSGRYPTIDAADLAAFDDEGRFEEGLSLMLDGLRARLTARAGGAAGVPLPSPAGEPATDETATSER